MKKLLGIIVLGLLLSGNAYAKDVKLSCNHIKKESFLILLMNDNKRFLKIEDIPGSYITLNITNFDKDRIEGYDEYILEGKLIQKLSYSLDRRTGFLNSRIWWADGDLFTNRYKCEVIKENKF